MEWKVSVHIMCRKGKYCFMKILFYLHVLKKKTEKAREKVREKTFSVSKKYII